MMKVGAKYANRKNGHVVVIDEVSDKFPTVAIMNLDGSNRHKVNKSSFQKSYKLLEEPENAEKDVVKAETEKTAKEPEKPVEKSSNQAEKSEKAEKKATKSKRVDNSASVALIMDFVRALMDSDENLSIGVPRSEEMKFRALRYGKKQFCKLMWSAKSVRLYFREEGVAKVSSEVQKVNYNLPYLYIVTKAEKSSYDNIKKMFQIAVDSEKK